MRRHAPAALVAAGLALAACQAPETLNPGFGDSVRHNTAMHVINPDPAPADAAAPDLYGQRGANAMTRYTTDQTEALEDVSASDM